MLETGFTYNGLKKTRITVNRYIGTRNMTISNCECTKSHKNTAYSDELGPVLSNFYVTPNKEHEASYASYGYYLAIHEE
jgi:hypothetical protein